MVTVEEYIFSSVKNLNVILLSEVRVQKLKFLLLQVLLHN